MFTKCLILCTDQSIPSFPKLFEDALNCHLFEGRRGSLIHCVRTREVAVRLPLMMVYARLSALLLLLALTHCYIWTRKKPDGPDASPSIGKTRRRVKAGSKYAKQSTQISEEVLSYKTRVSFFFIAVILLCAVLTSDCVHLFL